MFIAFDGIDGAGKSSLLLKLSQKLQINGQEVEVANMGQLGYIDSYIKGIGNKKYNCSAEIRELLYYFEGILFSEKKACKYQRKKGKSLLIDRYILSYFAYGPLNGVPLEEIKMLTENMVWPDVYFYLDISPENAYNRISNYRKIQIPEIGYKNAKKGIDLSKDNFLSHQLKVRGNFIKEIENSELNIVILDGMQPFEILIEQCMEKIQDYI